MPVEPEQRVKDSAIRIERCDEKDADKIAEGLYTCWPESAWARREPLSLRPPNYITRQNRLAARLRPSFTLPHMHWLKAVQPSTGATIGIAGWTGPGTPIMNILRRDAVEFYGWQARMGWSDEELADMWAGVTAESWSWNFAEGDRVRAEVLGQEKHWYLTTLFTWPEYRGRGVGKMLLEWAFERADAMVPVTPLYLEASPAGRGLYLRVGFVPLGEVNMVRRGPGVVRGGDGEVEEAKKEPVGETAGRSVELSA
ncbi:acyl-CoA N-acyltransferase [Massariosphaeria phaeospora]|uniref:Acyl-CoA N-acyltransferase n=1 Tax=Massariosphaeria phaeospora TaxID=100035 RepID=A0A7C8IGJ7_9PLEO|nr:acyl-CoA N-acyltransferase [Massariosphaeria phaeospora]